MEKKVMFENGKKVIESLSVNLRAGDKEYKSLSQVLKDIQRRNLMTAGYKACFEAVGLPTDGSVTPSQIFNAAFDAGLYVEVSKGKGSDKKTEKVAAVIVERTNKDTGEKENKLQKVSSWTARKLFTMIAQTKG